MRYVALTTTVAPFTGLLEAVNLAEAQVKALLAALQSKVPSTMSEDQFASRPADHSFLVKDRRILFVYAPKSLDVTDADWEKLARSLGVLTSGLSSAANVLKALRSDAGPSRWGITIPPDIRVNTNEVPTGSVAVATQKNGQRLLFLVTGPSSEMYAMETNPDGAAVAGYSLARPSEARKVVKWLQQAETFCAVDSPTAYLDQTLLGPFATGRLLVPSTMSEEVEYDENQFVVGVTAQDAQKIGGDRPAFVVTSPSPAVLQGVSAETEHVNAHDLAALAASSRGGSYTPGVKPENARVPDSVLLYTLQDIFNT